MPTGHKPSYSIISKENPPRPSDTAAHGPAAPDAVPNRGTATARSPFDGKRQVLASEPPTAPADARNSYRPPLPSTRRERSGRTEITSRKRRKQASRRTHFRRSDPNAPASCGPLPASGPYTRPRKTVAASEAARMPYTDASPPLRHHGSFRTMPFHAAAVPSNNIDKTLFRCNIYFVAFLRLKVFRLRPHSDSGPHTPDREEPAQHPRQDAPCRSVD